MMRGASYILKVLLFLLIGVACETHAHQQKEAISSLLFNVRTGNIEVSHRFYIHDAEHAVKGIFDGKADLMKDSKVQSAFADYVVESFSLVVNQDSETKLNLIGHEVEGKFFWIYQEAPISDIENLPKQLKIEFDALMEVWSSQRNIINIEGLGALRSIELISSQSKKTIHI